MTMFGELISLRRPSDSSASEKPALSSLSFPVYLLPSLHLPFRRRRATSPSRSPRAASFSGTLSSSDSSPSSPSSSSFSSVPALSVSNSPAGSPSSPVSPRTPGFSGRRLSRTHPTTLRCRSCAADLAFHSQIVSKSFVGRHGRAYLVAPPPPSVKRSQISSRSSSSGNTGSNSDGRGSVDSSSSSSNAFNQGYQSVDRNLVNITVGKHEERQLVTGMHTVADISCAGCGTVVGWKYIDAQDERQKYKVGKFILETRRVIGFHSWEDIEESNEIMLPHEKKSGHNGEDDSDSIIVFDSDDEDELEDIFTAVWDPVVVAEHRRSRTASMSRENSGMFY